jgi:AraC-like DNA-binding protein
MDKKPTGRPKKDIPLDKLKALMRMNPTIKDTAAFFECSIDTIEERIKEYTGLSFPEFKEQNMVHSRLNLIRKAMELADKGNVPMLIFCLKNLCGWSDKFEHQVDPKKVFQVVFNDKPRLVKPINDT